MEPKKAILDFSITDYSDAEACDERNLVHRSKLDDFMRVFTEQLSLARDEMSRWNDDKRNIRNIHNAISIYASRGAGKTTFLLSAIKKVQTEYGNEVVCLDTIDPSLMDTKQKPIVNIIAAIHEKVREAGSDINIFSSKEKADLVNKLDVQYKAVLKALPFIDGIGKDPIYSDWDDEEYIANQGIEKAIAGNNLERAFQQYLFIALKLMKKKCFVIPFDDIDTDFKKGYDILEIIRKYLTTPFIITVLTGDLELYGKLVRKETWKCFDNELMKKELEYAGRKDAEFSSIINQLENQYLVKILKPEYRISIGTIREYMENTDYRLNVTVKFYHDQEPILLDNCYDRFLSEVGFDECSVKTIKELRDFLLGLSMRIQIRLLRQIKRIYIDSNIHREELAEGVMDVFWNDLNQKASNAKALHRSSQVYTIEMLKFLTYNKALAIGCPFMPETTDDIFNKALFAVGVKYNTLQAKYAHIIFDFWIRLSYVSSISEHVQRDEFDDEKERIIDYANFKSDTGLTESVCMSQAYYNKSRSMYGQTTSLLPGVSCVDNTSPLFIQGANYQLSLLPLFGVTDAEKNDNVFISIYKLIALLSDLIRIISDSQVHDMDSDTIANLLVNQLGQYRSYQEPNFGPNSDFSEIKDRKSGIHFSYDESLEENASLRTIVNEFIEWYEKSNRYKMKVSCQMLHKIFVRFYNTVLHIDSQGRNLLTGDLLNQYVVALLNSVLVEEAMERRITRINLNYIDDIEDVYARNLSRINVYRGRQRLEILGLHSWLSDCPLIKVFLSPTMRYLAEHADMVGIQYHRAWKSYQRLTEEKMANNKVLEQLSERLKNLKSMQKEMDNLLKLNHQKRELEWYEKYLSVLSSEDERKKADKRRIALQLIVSKLLEDYRRPIGDKDLCINLKLDSSDSDIRIGLTKVISEIGKLEMQQEEKLDIDVSIENQLKKIGNFPISDYQKMNAEETPYKILNESFSKRVFERDTISFPNLG